ncbi:peptide deformylase [candidate division KSB1 bacterium]|nr:peptide deformylase [candidate division KSB1 bacterium]
MIFKKIITYPDPILLAIAQPVEEINPEIRDILDEMTHIMNISDGIGLAAPQIGISKRLITVGLNGRLYQLINPNIGWKGGIQTNIEGCLSLPNQEYEVTRAREVVVVGINTDNKPVTLLVDGLLACVFQHEIDHLDGELINASGTFVSSDEMKQAKN